MDKAVSNGINQSAPITLSIGILAWNEEEAIGVALDSLFRQSLFAELSRRHLQCEILCVANGCTDRTAAIAGAVFEEQTRAHPYKEAFCCGALNLPKPGKTGAWNSFVHELSAPQAQVLFLMDGDIALHHPQTLWNMYAALRENPWASIATDQPLKDIALKRHPSVWERLSLATSRMTQRGAAQLTGQLYCIRAAVARKIYLPRDLVACEDGFIKAMACTAFLTEDLSNERVVLAPDASHVFQAYTRAADILRNQKRQMIGQTIVHILVDGYLTKLPLQEKRNLADTIRKKEQTDPDWLKRLIAAHLRRARFFWRLFPDLLSFRFRRLARLKGRQRLLHFPSALAGFLVALLAGWLAGRFLRRGATHYWPDTRSPDLGTLTANESGTAEPAPAITCK